MKISHNNHPRGMVIFAIIVLIPNEVDKLGCMVIVRKKSRFRFEVSDFNGDGFIGQEVNVLNGENVEKILNIYSPPSWKFDSGDARSK